MGSAAVLESGVLVLNRVFQAIQVTSVRRAFGLLYKGDARAVDYLRITIKPKRVKPCQSYCLGARLIL